MSQQKLPAKWSPERVRRALEHYERQTDDEAALEDEEAFEPTTHTVMEIPVELVPEVRELIAKHRGD